MYTVSIDSVDNFQKVCTWTAAALRAITALFEFSGLKKRTMRKNPKVWNIQKILLPSNYPPPPLILYLYSYTVYFLKEEKIVIPLFMQVRQFHWDFILSFYTLFLFQGIWRFRLYLALHKYFRVSINYLYIYINLFFVVVEKCLSTFFALLVARK